MHFPVHEDKVAHRACLQASRRAIAESLMLIRKSGAVTGAMIVPQEPPSWIRHDGGGEIHPRNWDY
jgi:hypothetical protein